MNKNVIIAFLGNAKFDARCINMANSLFNHGYKVIIIDELVDDEENLESKRFKIFHVKTKFKNGIKRYWNFYCEVKKLNNQIKPNIFIAADLFSLGALSNLNESCLKIYDCREVYSKLTSLVYKPIKQLFWTYYEKINYKYIDKVLVTAKKDKEFLISKYGLKDISLILNFPNIQNKKSMINIREKFKISENNKIFLYQGAIQIGRGIEQMITLLHHFEDSVVCIIGKGEHKQKIIQLINKLNISKRVFFTGNIPYTELISVSKQADIGFSLIQPLSKSYKQALPNKLFEYGLAGIPTIASNFSEMKNYIARFKLGIAVEPNNINDHINAVNKLLKWDDSKLLINTVKDNCTWDSQEQKFIDLFS
jgi:glycosyltransferase involved in cell wall biosynthesis